MRKTFILGLALLAAACGGGSTATGSLSPTPAVTTSDEGNAQAPIPGNPYLYGKGTPPVALQPSSAELLSAAPKLDGLHETALKSTAGTAAVFLVEDDPNVTWGTLLKQAEPRILEAFAADPSLGSWLILMTDVVVHQTQDPIHPTAYRWTRQQVQDFVKCGIPTNGTNDCTDNLFKVAATAIVYQDHIVHPGL